MSNLADQQITEIVTNRYEEPFQFLKAIEAGYPSTKAHFDLMNGKHYMKTERDGFSGANSIILITQVVLATIISSLHNKRIPELQDIDLPMEEAVDVIKKMVVSRYHDISFKRPILRNGEQEMTLTLNIDKVINMPKKGLVFFRISYDICNGSFSGKATAAFNANKYDYLKSAKEAVK